MIQTNITIDPYKKGDTIQVRHLSGHQTPATFHSVDAKGATAIIIFGMSGDRKVRVTHTATMGRGKFVSKDMYAWHLDDGTLERIKETYRVDTARRAAATAKARGR